MSCRQDEVARNSHRNKSISYFIRVKCRFIFRFVGDGALAYGQNRFKLKIHENERDLNAIKDCGFPRRWLTDETVGFVFAYVHVCLCMCGVEAATTSSRRWNITKKFLNIRKPRQAGRFIRAKFHLRLSVKYVTVNSD